MKKVMVDLMLVCINFAIFAVTWLYPQEIRNTAAIWGVSIILMPVFLLLAIRDWKFDKDSKTAGKQTAASQEIQKEIPVAGGITEIILLSEDNTEIMAWDIYHKVSVIIGRDVGENRVDISLNQSPYASMVDIEHAVLNFAGGNWYVSDLESQNGIRVEKAQDGQVYRIASDVPCRIESGDCLYVGLSRLLFR
ncbi:FHA domain-containing protein [Lacrimispora brassicae]